ncbi:MAG: 30S ribosomal protein S12 methylthiotransferase RimO [Synergistaceae bacterium]|nr:30S ribosomal protein S12 methylthiotransferase RimO [Synergistaceae bacterium]
MKIFFVSMGCAKNTADSEHLISRLIACGHEIIDESSTADAAIINTCGFIQDAVKENISAILDLEELKTLGQIKTLIIAGCLVNRYESELRQEFPSVDLFARSEEWDKVINFLGGHENNNCKIVSPALNKNFWTRYLKITEGCNTLCSYCAIPLIRGKLRSVPLETLINEAHMLAISGAREICLVGQDLTVYGQDFNNGTSLKTLIHELNNELPAGTWIRLLYLHPNRVNEDLINFLLEHEKVLHYLDIPIQHADPEILSRMNRPVKSGHLEKIFSYIRSLDNLFTLRTTIMTGFPGESNKNFERVIDFISEIEFDRLGCFVYSPEEGTKAAKFPDQVPHKISESRCNKLMQIQSQISQERSELFINRELDILVEELDPENKQVWGRSYRDAPEVDGLICVSGCKNVKPGDLIRAKIYDCEENDLFGEVI